MLNIFIQSVARRAFAVRLPAAPHVRALLCAVFLLFVCSSNSAQHPGEVLNRTFQGAKAALASGNMPEAERQFNKTIALGLSQVANLSASESRYDEAQREFDEALKFAPNDPAIAADAAGALFRAGNIKKARQMAQSVVEQNPQDARAQEVLGRIDLYEGNFDAAIRELQVAVTQNHDFQTSYFLGLAYLKAKRFEDAQKWFQHLQKDFAENAALHVLIGRAYSIAHYPEPAVAEFRRAVQLDPKYPHAHSLLGYSILEFSGEAAYPEARMEFQSELRIRPDDYNALLLLGISDVALREFAGAEVALRHAIRVRPDEAYPYLYLGETYSETKRLELAVEYLEKYLKVMHNPEEAPRDVSRAYFLLGQALRRLGRAEEAQKALAQSQYFREKKFRYDAQHIFDEPGKSTDGDSHTSDRVEGLLQAGAPKDGAANESLGKRDLPEAAAAQHSGTLGPAGTAPETKTARQYRAFVREILASSYNDLGVMRAKNNEFAAAAENFKQAASWNPALSGLDRNWGFASFRAELYAEAIPPLERHLKVQPDDAFTRQLLGLSYSFSENYEKVVAVLRPLLEHPPDDPGLLFAWGTALVNTHQPEAAANIFRRLLEQNANNAPVHMVLGQLYAQQRDYANALAELKTALQLDSRLPEAHYYTGLVYLRQSEFELAAQEFRAELELQPAHTLATYHLGYALLAEGHAEEAAPLFREVIKATPRYQYAYFELGRALLALGDADGAIASLQTATELAPDHDASFFQLSQAYRRAGRAQDAAKALATYQKMIEANRTKKRQSMETAEP